MDTRLPLWIALLGSAPFVVLSMAIAFGWTAHPDTALLPLLQYAAIIVSFLGGIHWGIATLHAEEHTTTATLMILESTLAALLAWCILWIGAPHIQLLCFAFLYALLWGVDSVLYNARIIPLWFFQLRGVVTPIVVVSMYVGYFSIIAD